MSASPCAQLQRCVDMLSGVSNLLARTNSLPDFLAEACDLALSIGGYAAAVAALHEDCEASRILQCVASRSSDSKLSESLGNAVLATSRRSGNMISGALRRGEICVWQAPSDPQATAQLQSFLLSLEIESAIALPLLLHSQPVGLLFLVSCSSSAFGPAERGLLRDVASTLSFAVQFMHQQVTIQRLASFDPHTTLARRPLFCQRVDQHLQMAIMRRGRAAVIVLDVGRLSVINDSIGRSGGDCLLRLIGERLSQAYGGAQQVAHFGGGTFAICLDTGSCHPCEKILQRAISLFDLPFTVDGRELSASARAGAAFFPSDARGADALVQKAELALCDAREHGERCLMFSAQKHSEVIDGLAMENRLRSAFRHKQFLLHYQPQVDVATGRVTGAEALIRWKDPTLGEVAPVAFLPILESRGLMGELGEWIVNMATHDMLEWQHSGLAPLRIAVNVSTSQLRQKDFNDVFCKARGRLPAQAWGLDIEITEGALNHNAQQEIAKLAELRASGVRVAIDDFGTGYSSLARLMTLPVDILKIDRSFIPNDFADAGKLALLRTIVGLARALNMTTVAEGIETSKQLLLLRKTGCDQFQGFLHSRPMGAADFCSFALRQNSTNC